MTMMTDDIRATSRDQYMKEVSAGPFIRKFIAFGFFCAALAWLLVPSSYFGEWVWAQKAIGTGFMAGLALLIGK